MNNFEKFKNKEITKTESSEVMGGAFYHACTHPVTSSICVFFEFNTLSMFCAIGDIFCYDLACLGAYAFCENVE